MLSLCDKFSSLASKLCEEIEVMAGRRRAPSTLENFDPARVNFLFAWVGSAIFGLENISQKIPNFSIFNFFPFESKKMSLNRVKKYPDQRWVNFYLLWVKSMLESSQGPSLVLGLITPLSK